MKESEYRKSRARYGEHKTVFLHDHPKNAGFKAKPENKVHETRSKRGKKIVLNAGVCPCATCGHTSMRECEENDCQCCSQLCT